MIEISIDNKYYDFIAEYADKLTLNGFSNLSSSDLKKASRNSYQFSGLYGEAAYFLWRFNSLDQLKLNLDKKLSHYYKTKEGDSGCDDTITYKNSTRFIDIKSSHCENEDRIKYLNLIIPPREFHSKMIYIAAFPIGPTREKVNKVVLAGWCFNENIKQKWKFDEAKWCMPVIQLNDMEDLNVFL